MQGVPCHISSWCYENIKNVQISQKKRAALIENLCHRHTKGDFIQSMHARTYRAMNKVTAGSREGHFSPEKRHKKVYANQPNGDYLLLPDKVLLMNQLTYTYEIPTQIHTYCVGIHYM